MIAEFDESVLRAFIDWRIDWLTPIIVSFTKLTAPSLILLYTVVAGSFYRRLWPIIAVAVANTMSHFAKHLIARPRPQGYQLVEQTNGSMPSGHAVGAAAFALVLTLLTRRWWTIVVWLLAALISLSRLYVAVHWPTDLAVGWVLGAAIVGIVWFIRRRIPTTVHPVTGRTPAN